MTKTPHEKWLSDGHFWSGTKFLVEKHLSNCKIIPHRFNILDLLPKNSICGEIGVWKGDFSQEILTRCSPFQLYLIESDINQVDFLSERFDEQTNVQIKHGMSWDILKDFQDNYFDWLYIDADHSYESTLKELKLSHDKIKQGGLILLHDYIWVSYVSGDYKPYGVIKAVNEFCLDYNYEFVYKSMEPNMYHTVCIKEIN